MNSRENIYKVTIILVVILALYVLYYAVFQNNVMQKENHQIASPNPNIRHESNIIENVNADRNQICEILLQKSESEAVTDKTPPRTIPANLYNEFTLGGKIPVISHYRNDAVTSQNLEKFSRQQIDSLVEKAKNRETYYYGSLDKFLYQAIDKFPLKGKHVAILGSRIPWYESICIAYGAASCTTIEYNKVSYDHPQIKSMTVEEYHAMKNKPVFDVALSISSYEHDGLGRYGDPIRPNGDILAMLKAKCMVKENGLLFLAVPTGKDKIEFNAHRIYGSLRLPLLLNSWHLLESFGLDFDMLFKDLNYIHHPGEKNFSDLVLNDSLVYVLLNTPFFINGIVQKVAREAINY